MNFCWLVWLGVWREKLINQAYTLGLPSMNCFLLSPPTTISDPNMGTMTARAENVAATILSSVSRRPINIWIKRKKHNQMNVQRRKTDPLRLVECEAKSEKSERNGFGPILAHSTTLNRDGEILPDHRQKHRKIQLRLTFTQRCLFKFTSRYAKNYTTFIWLVFDFIALLWENFKITQIRKLSCFCFSSLQDHSL